MTLLTSCRSKWAGWWQTRLEKKNNWQVWWPASARCLVVHPLFCSSEQTTLLWLENTENRAFHGLVHTQTSSWLYSTIKLLRRDEDINIQVESTLWRCIPDTTLAFRLHSLHLPSAQQREKRPSDVQATVLSKKSQWFIKSFFFSLRVETWNI